LNSNEVIRGRASVPEASLEVFVQQDQLVIFQYYGEDAIDEFVQELEMLGVDVKENFNSPCG